MNVFLAGVEASSREGFYAHLHVFPRFAGDAFRISADWSVMPERAALDAIAAKIRAATQAK